MTPRTLVALSVLDDGPRHARDYLNKAGIVLVVLQHLPHTYLDGAVFLRKGGSPVIALTLRYDRLDNFWFVLLHELETRILHGNVTLTISPQKPSCPKASILTNAKHYPRPKSSILPVRMAFTPRL